MVRLKAVFAGMMGNVLDAYDLVIYGFMSGYIAANFFKTHDEMSNLILAFYVFLIGYLTRPLGSILFGFIADFFGRKKALLISISIIGITTTAIGLLPTYATWGIIATFLLLIFRIGQSIVIGGEYMNSITFLVEHAENRQRGFMGAWGAVGVNLGILIASIVGLTVSYLLSHHLIAAWGWRLPFLITSIGAFIGLWIRFNNSETLPYILENSTESSYPAKTHVKFLWAYLKTHSSACIISAALVWIGVCSTYLIYIYLPIHLALFRHLSTWKALKMNVSALFLLVMLIPIFGYLSDRYGRKIFLTFAMGLFTILAYPLFWSASYGNLTEFFILQMIISIASASLYSIAPVVMVEMIPTKIRGSISTLLYGTFAGISGGIAPLVSLLLATKTHNLAAPGLYLMLCSILALGIIAFKYKTPFLHKLKKYPSQYP